MKLRNTLIALVAGSLLTVGVAFAAADAKVVAKAANCCANAAKDGKTCSHECCVKAAKDGNNCTTCAGAGKIADNPKPAKK
jgi:hypothetical protein